ncbi:protein vein-like isoform X1 [Dinothrombium tinctorium]|uniref:Protein vein-like isoform X1 n=1 Tax=Dinothrombium tinctorium TaxID=1965070 RepID=A0A443RED3_9ACAR|nr:protein vein-like isoform X1 [Dinothrombium tinctorium]
MGLGATHMQSCPEGPPSQWESQLDVASKAYLSPIVFNGKLISLAEDRGRIAATFRVQKQIKNIGSTSGTVPVNLLPGTLVTLYFVRIKAWKSVPPYCAVYLNETIINNLKPEKKYLVFAASPLKSLVELHKQLQLTDSSDLNNLRTPSHHIRHFHPTSSSNLYINYLSAFASPEPHNKRSSRAVRRILCHKCAKAPQVKGLSNVDLRVELRGKLRLRCKVTGNPFPWIEWFRNGKRLKSRGRIVIRNKKRVSRLEIRNVQPSTDTGYYECRAMNVVAREPSIGRARIVVTRISSASNRNHTNRSPVRKTSTKLSTTTASPVSLWPMSGRPCPIASFCLNGGTCTLYEVVGEYVCQCAEGFRGQRCENKDIYTLVGYIPLGWGSAQKDMWDYGATSKMFQLYWTFLELPKNFEVMKFIVVFVALFYRLQNFRISGD